MLFNRGGCLTHGLAARPITYGARMCLADRQEAVVIRPGARMLPNEAQPS